MTLGRQRAMSQVWFSSSASSSSWITFLQHSFCNMFKTWIWIEDEVVNKDVGKEKPYRLGGLEGQLNDRGNAMEESSIGS